MAATDVPAVVSAPWVTLEVVGGKPIGLGFDSTRQELRLECGHCGARAHYAPRVELLALVEAGRQFHRAHQLCPPPKK